MNESALYPRSLKAGATASRWLLWPLLALWLVFAIVWGGLHGWIVPRIDELRPWLERQATLRVGVPVRIGSISAQSHGLLPTFEMHDVSLLDSQGRDALRLPRVVGSLSPGSLWNLGFEQLFIDQPDLDIRRNAQGRILVAGLDLGSNANASSTGTDWLFAQTEFLIRNGTVHWTDELRRTPTLALDHVDLVLRNGGRKHGLRMDATPPPEWGQRFSLRAMFRQPLLSKRNSRWKEWDGQIYADFAQVDVSHLQQYADLGITVSQGQGALRVWGDVVRGELVGATADAALVRVNTRLDSDLTALDLEQVQGRANWRALSGGFEFGTEGLQFQTRDGLHWPGGNVFVSYTRGEGRMPAQGELRADHLDLQALSQIANRLPLGEATHRALLAYRPKGQVERIQAHWQGNFGAVEKYSASGRVSALEVAAQPAPQLAGAPAQPGSPGVRGISADFEMTQTGGKAQLSLLQGALEFPGIFEEASVPLDQFTALAQWQVDGERLAVQLANVKFANTDAQGEFQAQWHSADPLKSSGHSRFPGVLQLQGSLSRGEAARVYRYLPLVLPLEARNYVRHAVLLGRASGTRFLVRGDLADMPFANPKLGEFRISTQVQDATLAFMPRALQAQDEPPWPALTQLNGELVFDRASLQVKAGKANVLQAPGLSLTKVEAQIPDMLRPPVLTVSADARGPLQEVLRILSGSPLGAMLGHALDKSVGTGVADYRLRLNLPLQDLDKSRVQGSVTLAGNDLHITPDSPVLGRSRGVINFTESGFNLVGAQVRMLGGEARIEGGMRPANMVAGGRENVLLLRAQGQASAEGLRAARELGPITRLAQNAIGSTAYSASFGVQQGVPELSISSSLQGLSLGLPAPLNKSAESVLPLRYESALLRDGAAPEPQRLRDKVTLELGRVAALSYVRDVTESPARVLRGGIAMGLPADEATPTPAHGVSANLLLGSVDLDAWDEVLTRVAATPALESPAIAASATRSAGLDAAAAYLPTSMALRARSLSYGGYQMNNVVLGGSRDGLNWRANLQAAELDGYLEYRQANAANPGRVYARLAQLKIAPNAVKQVEHLLEDQPRAIPALDIVVDDLELRGKKLGRVEIEAVNRVANRASRDTGVREWQLNKFNLINPQGSLTASGNWAAPGNAEPGERRHTVMNFKLDVADAGGLLARLGMKDVVARGAGLLEGQVSWAGSPLTLDYPSMGGKFNVNVENGQFLQVEPGAAKLLGVLSLQSLPRRLTLDFRDVFSTGFAFDFIRGDVQIENGIASTNNLQMKGVNAAVLMEGRADLARETQNLKVVVVPEINAGTASLVATIINPAVGLGSFLAQMFLRKPLIEANTQELHIDGSWTDYKVTRVEHRTTVSPQPQQP
jgi:uncharacterized protein (TIGR02099 family)